MNLNSTESAVLKLSVSEFSAPFTEVVLSAFYSNYRDLGRFKLIAAMNKIPSSAYFNHSQIESESMTAIS